ncbi:glycoside hydrolase [Aureobasidium pullulans EXF-150]|uniref:glucan 1,3-beta-glucosidase n=1 Tax=Aureobasidium pullulans EXF-150 TaxID=1043002 RepID=A0A074XVI2_AURPU|nr:glycoside hydrolase [Aureobasidium pullulans EXF-150]KEQ78651.1 glycoside hydrolase [Aureobasidium pullulans EXF-150]
MRFSPSFALTASLAVANAAAIVPSENLQERSLGKLISEIIVLVKEITTIPIVIDQQINKNTVISTNGVTCKVTNAPTHLRTTLYKTTSVTKSSTKTSTSTVKNGNGQSTATSVVTSTSSSVAPVTTISVASTSPSVSSASSASSHTSASSVVSVNTSAAGTGLNTDLYTATSTYPQSSTTVTTVVTSTSTGASTTKVVSSTGTTTVPASTTSLASGEWTDWTIYSANGVNLGNWLEIERSNNQYFWDSYVNGSAVTDEWTFCKTLGNECGSVLEAHYGSAVTTETIDKLAGVGINFLRIPTTTYGMRVVIGLHSLPGGVNGLDIGEASGHDAWFYNETNLEYSYKAVSAVLSFVEASSYSWAYTLSVLNEASDTPSAFATADTLTTNGTQWIVDYTNGVFDLIAESSVTKLPVMLQDCFLGEEHWSSYFASTANLVIDTHIYYFAASGIYSEYVNSAVCGQASVAPGDGKFPVFIGEWSLQVLYNNTYEARESIFNTQRYAWSRYVQGGSFWGAIFNGTDSVDGEGTQRDYWSYNRLIDAGVVKSPTNATYC